MAYFGNIRSYDSVRGAGTISPESGGDALPFKRADLQQQGQEPQVDQRYGFDTMFTEFGRKRAVNLHQPGDANLHREQARKQKG